jgi:hypothetical protein
MPARTMLPPPDAAAAKAQAGRNWALSGLITQPLGLVVDPLSRALRRAISSPPAELGAGRRLDAAPARALVLTFPSSLHQSRQQRIDLRRDFRRAPVQHMVEIMLLQRALGLAVRQHRNRPAALCDMFDRQDLA